MRVVVVTCVMVVTRGACAWRTRRRLRTVGEGGGRLNGNSAGGNGRYIGVGDSVTATVSSCEIASEIGRDHTDDASGCVAGFGGLESRPTTRRTGVRW